MEDNNVDITEQDEPVPEPGPPATDGATAIVTETPVTEYTNANGLTERNKRYILTTTL